MIGLNKYIPYMLVAGILILLFWFWKRGAAGVASDVTSTAVQAASGAAAGIVEGVSQTVGIPNTSQDKCLADQAAGLLWEASFDCNAPTFIKSLWNKAFSTTPLQGTTK